MISLIKNELIKIFNKKSTYIMFAFIFIFVSITNYIYKRELDESGNFKLEYSDISYIDYLKEELDNIGNDEDDKEYEISLRSDIMKFELIEKYGVNSWQEYIIDNNMNYIFENIVRYKYIEVNDELLDKYEEEYKLLKEKLDSNDYKYFINLEIEDINNKKLELDNNITYPDDLKKEMNTNYDL